MTMARAHLVDPSVTRWYHCITRCVRRAFLLGEGASDRKLWIDSGRPFREGKAMISRDVSAIFERLGTTAETWQARLEKLSKGRLMGRFFAASRQRLRDVAARLGLRRAVNLGSCLLA